MNVVSRAFHRWVLGLVCGAGVCAALCAGPARGEAAGASLPASATGTAPLAVEERKLRTELDQVRKDKVTGEAEVQRLLGEYTAATAEVSAKRRALEDAKAAKATLEKPAPGEAELRSAITLVNAAEMAARPDKTKATALMAALAAEAAAAEADKPARKQELLAAAKAAAAKVVSDAEAAVTRAKDKETRSNGALEAARRSQADLNAREAGLTSELEEVQNIRNNAVALGSRAIYEQSLKALTILFVVAVLLENALAVVFSWRFFLTYVNVRVARTPIMVVAATVVVFAFGLDVLSSLIAIYKAPEGTAPDLVANAPNWFSKLMTALIIAGGSAGVTNVMRALGYRKTAPEENAPAGPKAKQGWVAVRLKRKALVGDALVRLEVVAPQPNPLPAPIVGTINEKLPPAEGLLLRNKNRFPQNGGYPVDVDKVYRVIVTGEDAGGNALKDTSADFMVAEKAIVDLEVEL